jgi:hypothetical protein
MVERNMTGRGSKDPRLLVTLPRVVRGPGAICPMVVGMAGASPSDTMGSVESVQVSVVPPSAVHEAPRGRTVRAAGSGVAPIALRPSARELDPRAAVGGTLTLRVEATVVRDGRPTSVVQTHEIRIAQPLGRLEGWWAGDAHVHTRFSDALLPWATPHWEADIAAAAGLDWIVLTDHAEQLDETEYGRLKTQARAAQAASGVTVIVGEEIGLSDGHYLVLDTDRFLPAMTPAEAIRRSHEAGGFGYAAHPFGTSRWSFALQGFSGMEISKPWPRSAPERRAIEQLDRQAAARRGWAVMSNSDDHTGFGLRICLGSRATWVYTGSDCSESGVLAGLRAGRTVAGNGPVLGFTVGGVGVGGTLRAPRGAEVTMRAVWPSGYRFDRLVVVVGARRSEHEVSEQENGASSLELPLSFRADTYVRLEGYAPDEDFVITSPVFVNVGRGRTAGPEKRGAVTPA